MSNIINIQTRIQKLSQELLEAEKKMDEAAEKYAVASAKFWDNCDDDTLDEHNDSILKELDVIRLATEAHYDAIEDEIFLLEEELEDLYADEHSRIEED